MPTAALMRVPTSLSILLLLHLLLLFSRVTRAEFQPGDLRGLFVFSFGRALCPQLIQLDTRSLNVTFPDISVDGETCTAGTVQAEQSPGESAGLFSRYLSGVREVGDYIVATVTEDLVCPARTFELEVTRFVFLAPDERVVVSWASVFESNDTFLAMNSPSGNTYAFEEDEHYMVVSDICLYRRRSIPEDYGRACFPAAASAQLRSGAHVRMDSLRVGDEVRTSTLSFSRIIGFTHQSASPSAVLRLVAGNATLSLTPGHFVYADDELTLARDVRVGMSLRHVDVRKGAIVSAISWGSAMGMYNPHTQDGRIVVDGFVASCYTEAVAPNSAHAWLAPVRAIAWASVDLLGVTDVFRTE